MKTILLYILLLQSAMLLCQHSSEQIEHFCGHGSDHSVAVTIPPSNPDISYIVSCDVSTLEDYSTLNTLELYNALISSADPQNCVYRTLVSFSTVYSPLIFSPDKVETIAQLAKGHFSTFDGDTDNGSLALMTYLSFAIQYSSDYGSHISVNAQSWENIKDALNTYVNNEAALSQTDLSLYTTAHFLNASARDSLNADPQIIEFTGVLLDSIASDSYTSLSNIYPYYFCYYFLLDIYYRYAPLHDDFIDELSNHLDVIESLKNVAINTNLNEKTFVYFDDLSNFSVTGLTNLAGNPNILSTVLEALHEVNVTYDSFSPQWLTVAFVLAEHDDSYDYTYDQLTTELQDLTLPNTYKFDEGTFIIETALSYAEALSLYEAAQQVRAQFLRLIGNHSAVLNDQNDTLTAVVYGTRQDYVDYNALLYGINFPNSGGVYIESYGTFFTYDRESWESQFTLEELFRHEYTHYLQGRYLIPGDWGVHELYQDSRLVWLEEGMAQFLTGSTRTEGVRLIDVIRQRINSLNGLQGLEDIFASSYSTGNAHAYYDFSPLLWSYWYNHDRSLVDQLLYHLKHEEIAAFDSLVSIIEQDTIHEQLYLHYINDIIDVDSIWFTPESIVSPYDSMTSIELSAVTSQVSQFNPSFEAMSIDIIEDQNHGRFKISGLWQSGVSSDIESELDDVLYSLSSFGAKDPLNYSVGYFEIGDDDPTSGIPFYIEGPIGQYCELPNTDPAVFVDDDYAILFHFDGANTERKIRLRQQGQTDWNYGSATSLYYIDSLLNISSDMGYEYQIQYQCNEDSWSQYSDSYSIFPCPMSRQLVDDIGINQKLYSAMEISANSMIHGESSVGLYANEEITALPGFEVELGSELFIDIENCTGGDFD